MVHSPLLLLLYPTYIFLDKILASNSVAPVVGFAIVSKVVFRRSFSFKMLFLPNEFHDNIWFFRGYQKIVYISTNVLVAVNRFGQLDPNIPVKSLRLEYNGPQST